MLRIAVPLLILGFIGLIVILAIGLNRDPRLVPSPLVGKPVPAFVLPLLHDKDNVFDSGVLKGEISLLNVWASWCVSCRVEHPLLLEIAKQKVMPVYGLNYKDSREDAINWLARLGDPYESIAFDEHGKVAIDLGVYGAPETYLIDQSGMIAYKHIGPITDQDWEQKFVPVILKLQESYAQAQ